MNNRHFAFEWWEWCGTAWRAVVLWCCGAGGSALSQSVNGPAKVHLHVSFGPAPAAPAAPAGRFASDADADSVCVLRFTFALSMAARVVLQIFFDNFYSIFFSVFSSWKWAAPFVARVVVAVVFMLFHLRVKFSDKQHATRRWGN